MAEIKRLLLSNVTKQHAAKVEYPFSPIFVSELEPFDRESYFGKPKEIYYPPVDEDVISQPFEHEPTDSPAKEHGKPSPLPPVIGVRLKKSTAEVIRATVEQSGGGSRGAIKEISKNAIKNAVEILTNAEPELNSMVVVTYPETFPGDGRIVKAHLKSLRQAIERKWGGFEYFAAVEYQRRGAPHLHVAVSISLGSLGQVETLKRKKSGRRFPAFQTVKPAQDWLYATWKDIISKPNPRYNGESLDWSGITSNDAKRMDSAYFEHNSGVSWEVMRDRDGAKKYFVKELSGLKDYQKRIPAGLANPGRHFLYSKGMRFDDKNAIPFAVSEAELRQLLTESGWQYLPAEDKPLFKRLWNSAAQLAITLIERGYQPSKSTAESLRKYADMRMSYWVDKASENFRYWSQDADLKRYIAGLRHQKALQKSILNRMHWDFILSQEPMGP